MIFVSTQLILLCFVTLALAIRETILDADARSICPRELSGVDPPHGWGHTHTSNQPHFFRKCMETASLYF
jgi:hypothetical protein